MALTASGVAPGSPAAPGPLDWGFRICVVTLSTILEHLIKPQIGTHLLS